MLKANINFKVAPNGSVPENICSYGIYCWLARKRNREILLFIEFLRIDVKHYNFYLLM